MKLRELLKFAGTMRQIYPIEIVPIDRRIDHQIDVEWSKDYDGEGPEYEYDAASEKWEPFYLIPKAGYVSVQPKDPDGGPMRWMEKETLDQLKEMKLDLDDEGWMVTQDSLFHVRSLAEEALEICNEIEKAQELPE